MFTFSLVPDPATLALRFRFNATAATETVSEPLLPPVIANGIHFSFYVLNL